MIEKGITDSFIKSSRELGWKPFFYFVQNSISHFNLSLSPSISYIYGAWKTIYQSCNISAIWYPTKYKVLYHLCCLSWCNLTSPDWYLITNLLTLHNCWRHVNAAMAVTYWCIIALYKSCTYSNLNRQTKVNFYLWVTGK